MKVIKHFRIVLFRVSVEIRLRLFFVRSFQKVHLAIMCATVFTKSVFFFIFLDCLVQKLSGTTLLRSTGNYLPVEMV
jgi:hypothetical protein